MNASLTQICLEHSLLIPAKYIDNWRVPASTALHSHFLHGECTPILTDGLDTWIKLGKDDSLHLVKSANLSLVKFDRKSAPHDDSAVAFRPRKARRKKKEDVLLEW
jgi:hypothetical protein